MFTNDFDKTIQEGGYIRPTPSGTGYRHSAYDTSYDERKEFRKMARLYEGLIYLRREMRHMTKTQIMDRLAESYNYLAEIYDTIEDDYTEAPVRTSRLGFARRPRRTSTHRRDIDRLIYQIRREIIDLNGRAWNRTAVRGVIDQMLEVYEYEQRELGSIEHHGDRAVNAAVSHGARRLVERIMDQKIENVCDEIFQEEKLSTEDRKDLDDSQFGIPSLRKYPLTDKKHVLQAVRFFNKAPEEHKRELAKNIVKRAKELGMDWEKWESLKPYLDKKVQESVEHDAYGNKIKKIQDFSFDKVYFGTHSKWNNGGLDLDGPLFVTPYKRLASIFSVAHSHKQLKIAQHLHDQGIEPNDEGNYNYNMGYDEWESMNQSNKDSYVDTIHIRVEGFPDLKEYTVDAIGYVYEIDVSDLKDNIYQYPWMNTHKEYLLYDIDHINGKEDKLNVKCIIKGYPKNKFVEEATLIKDDRDREIEIDVGHDKLLTTDSHDWNEIVEEYPKMKDKLMKAGSLVYRITDRIESIGTKRKYVTLTRKEATRYADPSHGIVESESKAKIAVFKLKKDLKIAGAKVVLDIFEKVYHKSEFTFDDIGYFNFMTVDKKVQNELRSKGYDALFDPMDCSFVKTPTIILYPKEYIELDHYEDLDGNIIQESTHTSKDFKRVKKTCEELVEHLDEFKYGIPRKDGKIHHVKSAKDYEQNYHLLAPDEFVKYGGGVCWDYVEYEEKWLKEHDITCRKFYIITETPPNYDTHTIVVVSFEGKHIWIESSFKKLAGVHVFDNLRDIFKVITYKMFDFNGNKHKWHQFKYSVMDFTNKHPDYGSTNDEYMDWMASNARLIFDDVSKQDHPYTLDENKIISESVDINDLKRQCGEIYNQGLQIKYGCLDENGERIVASPFKDSWQMIVNYRSQSMESLQESKMGVCYEHSCYIAKLLKERNLPYQTFFLNVNIHVDSDHSLDCTFWHQFTIVPNDADSVVLIETSLTQEKNGVFLVANMDDAINHLIQSFDLNLSQEQIDAIERDLIDISSLEMKNGDTYLGYIQNVYRNGKLIEDNIRIKHRTEMMKLYWDYLNEHNYLSEDGKKIYEQIKEVDDDFRFEIQALSSIQELFTDEGNKFNEDFGIMDADVFFELTPSEMESKLKGFVQESFMGLKHNSLKADFNEIPLRPSTAKQYASQGVFNRNLGRIHLTPHTHGSIFTDENGVTVAYIAVEKKTDGNRWIVGMEVSQEFKHLKKEEDPYEGMDTLIGIKRPDDEEEEGIVHAKAEEPIDFTIQLLQIAVDEYHANRMVITKNNLDNLFMLQENGWEVEKEEDGKIILALNNKSVSSSKEDD